MNYIEILNSHDVEKLKEFLKTHNVNVEVQGKSLLYWAIYMNNMEFSELLINKGANINQKDTLERTPLFISCFFGFVEITSLLLKNGATIEAKIMDRAISGWNGKVQVECLNLLRKYGWVNLYLDDLRDIPDGFIGARTIEDAIEIIENHKVHLLSLDHDLGMDEQGDLRKTGYDLVKYICGSRKRAANKIYLHTDNVVGRDNMYQTLLAARRREFIDEDIEIYPFPYVRNKYTGEQDWRR